MLLTRAVFVFALIVFGISNSPAWESFAFHHVNVIGTNLELRLDCTDEETATQGEAVALQEIDRLAMILGSYDAASELNQWLELGDESPVSQELRDVLDASQQWHLRTHGTFHPGVEQLSRLWKTAEQKQQAPSPAELSRATNQLKQLGWQWNADRSKTKPLPGARLSFNAIAKGYIIDAVCTKLAHQHGIEGGLLAIGGDMRAFGSMQRMIKIQMPVDDLAAPSMATIPLTNQSIATSSGVFRGITIGDKKYSHLLDPRTGYPVEHIRSVTVVSPHAIDADALATACSILPVDESLAIAESLPSTSCIIIDSNGQTYASSHWRPLESMPATLVSTPVPSSIWNGGMELKVDFTIHQPDGGNRYRRPYVAVWIEDKDGFPVRTLVLWTQSGKGSRWLPDLKRWYRSDRLRKFVEDTDVVATVSEATRKPGAYSVTWNGEDDQKKLVGPGEYTLFIESAREHGTYQLIRKTLEFSDKPFQEKLEENIEIKAAAIDYRKLESQN